MKKLYLYIPILIMVFSSLLFSQMYEEKSQEMEKTDYTLKKLWETDKVLKVPESVFYDAERDILYVSNINGQPLEKNGEGFISKLKLDGTVETLKWVTGLNAPKGMAVHQGKLYVSDIDRLVAIDIEKGKIAKSYPAKGGIFLNDVTVDKDGNVYVSDSSEKNSVIYKLSGDNLAVWVKSDEINQPNGIYANGNKLLVGNFANGEFKSINFSDKTIKSITTTGFGIDGLVMDKHGSYLLSDWQGHTYVYTKTGELNELLDTTDDKINSADIEYIQDKKLLLIPTFFDNRVMAYRVGK